MTDSTLVGTHQPSLQQGNNTMHPRKQSRSFLGLLAKHSHLMTIPFTFQPRISLPSIRMNKATGFHRFFDKSIQTLRRSIGNSLHSDSTDTVFFFLCGCHNQDFAMEVTPTQPLFQASQIRFVNFHLSAQTVSSGSDHRFSQLVQQRPGRLVAASQDSLQSQGAHSILLTGDPPHGTKPEGQRQMSVLENCPCCDRSLITTANTLINNVSNRPKRICSTLGAAKTVGPAQLEKVKTTSFFRRKSCFKFFQGLGIIFHTPGILYVGGT